VAEPAQSVTAARLRERCEAVVRVHMESENVRDFDATIGTFSHPRDEIIPTGDVFDGEAEVRRYYAETRAAFPDRRNELIALHDIDDGVVVEFDLLGTHLGPLRSLAPTGRAFRCRRSAFFIVDDERIVCERVYFDQATILRQLGLAHEPTSVAGRISTLLSHPLAVGRALLRATVSRGAARG
jgi:steroid delta-isomerase-like uncharacterized protein